MIVYKTTNLKNGKYYIGKDAKNKKSYIGSGVVLKQAIEKYGKENFKKETLKECKTLEELDELEKFYISFFDSTNPKKGYNLTDGGTGGDTWTHNKLETHWNEGREPWNKGIRMPFEPWNKGTKGVMSKNKTSFKPGKDHVMYGKKQSKETIQKRVETRTKNGSYKGVGKFAPKQVIYLPTGEIYYSIEKAAIAHNLTRDQVGHSCRKETKKGLFRFV